MLFGMLSFEEAQALLSAQIVEGRVESVPMSASLQELMGRILAQPVTTESDQPSFDRATMDGYAVHLKEGATRFKVVDTVIAGQQLAGSIEPGQAIRIMTGAPCPSGLTVVPVERTDGGDDEVEIEAAFLLPEKNIAWRGQDAKRGDRVIGAGCRLGPTTLSAAAMAGMEALVCHVPPRIAVVTTGDEIGSTGPASVRNSNGPLLGALCSALAVPVERRHALDKEDHLRQVLHESMGAADIVVTVGGVSMGTRDLVPGMARELGFEPIFHHVAMKPGKPLFFARHPDGTFFIGLPGNPVSVLVTAHLFLAPLIGRFMGDWRPRSFAMPLVRDHAYPGKRRLFLPARLEDGGVGTIDWNGSGDFYAAAYADGLIDLEPSSSWKAGDPVRFLPFLGHTPGETGLRPGYDATEGDCC
ncbi:MAG: molybdopterin molybdotransferase MoeA [Planctomycetes bacterium]|nr:molybdopterin molybdotransferase MoeA [Planctomycetota bacterium]